MGDEPNDDPGLREGLADAVPGPPATPDRTEAARARARRARRTTAAVVVGAAASVLLVAGVVATLSDDGPSREDAADPGPLSPYDAPQCPAPAADESGSGRVPDGATWVRLCSGDGMPIEVPDDALVTRVDELAATVNGLDAKAPDAMCTLELGPGYQLVFGYPDGDRVAVLGGLYGCREVAVGGARLVGADEPWERFITLLAEQRERLDPPAPADPSSIDCPTATAQPAAPSVGRPADLVAAVYCVEETPGSGAWRRAEIGAGDLDVLRADIAAHTRDDAGMVDCDVTPPVPTIVGATAWGDRVVLRAQCTNGWFVADERTMTTWLPGDEARAVLDRLAGEAR